MAKKKILSAGKINQKNSETLKSVIKLMEDLGQEFSIKVGILQSQGGNEIVPGTDLSIADLGAVHEFGATINNPGGQPYYINSSTGLAVFVSKNSLFGKHLIAKGQVTKAHKITIPARSFLRATLLSSKGKSELLDNATILFKDDPELNKTLGEDALKKDSNFLENMAHTIGETAATMVNKSFEQGGSPQKWKDIKASSRKQRKYNSDAPPLTDRGELKDKAIHYEVKKVN